MKNILLPLLQISLLSTLIAVNASANQACDMDAGKKQFNKCAACHSLAKGTHMMGPSLYGIIDRPAGKTEGFMFSLAMEESQLLWSKANLHEFIANPMRKVPGTSMPFGGIRKQEQRDNLLCYIEVQSH